MTQYFKTDNTHACTETQKKEEKAEVTPSVEEILRITV